MAGSRLVADENGGTVLTEGELYSLERIVYLDLAEDRAGTKLSLCSLHGHKETGKA